MKRRRRKKSHEKRETIFFSVEFKAFSIEPSISGFDDDPFKSRLAYDRTSTDGTSGKRMLKKREKKTTQNEQENERMKKK